MILETLRASRAERLIAFIESTDDDIKRVEYIRQLGDLNLKSERIFKYFENWLLSDSSVFVRAEAARSLIMNFKEKSKTPLFWTIHNEKSACFFKILLDFIEVKKGSFSKVLEKEILRRLSSTYELYEEEARFIFDLEVQLLSLPEQQDLELGELVRYVSQDTVEVRLYQRRNGRMIALKLSGTSNPIPESIENLSKLRYLNIKHKWLNSVPESILKLKNLKELNLSANHLTNLPHWLSELPKLRRINLLSNRLKSVPECVVKIAKKHYAPLHVLEGIIPSEALKLGILDILFGKIFIKLSNNEQFLHTSKGGYSHCYKMNNEGYITALYYNLSGEPIFLLEFPEQIYDLKYLEELYIKSHKITKFPESIVGLKNLRIFDFKTWPNIVRDIPKSVVPFLLNLEKFECDEGILSELIDINNTQNIRNINIKYRKWNMSIYPEPIDKINSQNEGSAYDILVVDDDIQTIRLLQSFFETKGYILKGAVSGRKCLEKLELDQIKPNILYKPKIILMDIVLPDMSGYLVCEKIRESEIYNDSLIYILSARPKYEVEIKFKGCGADGYILKPFNLADFNIVFESLKN